MSVACAVMVVTGAVATASGPHPGADQDVQRLGLGITDTVYVHVRATAVYGIGLLLFGWQLVRRRRTLPGVAALGVVLLVVLLAQMLVGEIQYRNALPWGLVLVHVSLAAAIWALTVAVVHALSASTGSPRSGGHGVRRSGRRGRSAVVEERCASAARLVAALHAADRVRHLRRQGNHP